MLFLTWLAFIGYQVATTANPIVVARPQILVAPLIVEATMVDGDETFTVNNVLFGNHIKRGAKLTIRGGYKPVDSFKSNDIVILPLQPFANNQYKVELTPTGEPLIYPASSSVKKQLKPLIEIRNVANGPELRQ